ncbi:hypothetical protein TcCL_NonESM10227 [Trypanosoma cruzi]|uniref:Uncharacterized protein n=1 Tax=Trypanosoma cruzi (strain CL Brener) TaxID=353153 RepID=Q4DGW0_TRYCC|nr:hypothetical protein Tc00.1047053506975.70 [Trypanosoma cruzi]EAN91763.1 hypothetical protein Tc00.1047053506975.70 [Trypanosoma cruzi]RNC40314.1 hypothetical protein TcCL_NonESM10227 [Trypanosoma cruzi]|eukprot:XP_813614.1 hypothetical protein [Trypanosoma cruzi strain CL Brener]
MKAKCLLFVLEIIVMACVAQAETCRVNTSDTGESISLEYLSNYGNVSVMLGDVKIDLGVSFCWPKKFSAFGEECDFGYMIIYEKGCEGTFTHSDNVSLENDTLFFTIRSPNTLMADVYVECDESINGLRALSANETEITKYVFRFASTTVCPGYQPPGRDKFPSKGFLITIVTGIVGVVVVAAALFQWKSRSPSVEDYSQLI